MSSSQSPRLTISIAADTDQAGARGGRHDSFRSIETVSGGSDVNEQLYCPSPPGTGKYEDEFELSKVKVRSVSRKSGYNGKATFGKKYSRKSPVKFLDAYNAPSTSSNRGCKQSPMPSTRHTPHSAKIENRPKSHSTKHSGDSRSKRACIVRTQERDRKSSENKMLQISESHTLEICSPINFKTLRVPLEISLLPSRSSHSGGSATPVRCVSKTSITQERQDFSRTFSMLLKMGERREYAPLQYGSQISNNLSGERQKVFFADFIFLSIKAWSCGWDVRRAGMIELQEFDYELDRKRREALDIIDEISKFKCSHTVVSSSPNVRSGDLSHVMFSLRLTELESSIINGENANSTLNSSGYIPSVNASVVVSTDDDAEVITMAYLILQRSCLNQVRAVLEKYEAMESLYPSSRAMNNYLKRSLSPEFEGRLKTLYLWFNIQRDLCRKSKQVGLILEMHKIPNAKIDWPNLDYDSPCSSLITEMNANNLSNLTQSPESEVVAMFSAANVYRSFVERSLRGTKQILTRLNQVLKLSLDRALLALSIKDKIPMPAKLKQASKEQAIRTEFDETFSTQTTDLSDSRSAAFTVKSPDSIYKIPDIDCASNMELLHYGISSEMFKEMRLPSFLRSFLFLCKVPLQLCQQWLLVRCQQRPQKEPDYYTLQQLLVDAAEVLSDAINVKIKYQYQLYSVINDLPMFERLLKEMDTFETALMHMFEVYLGYVQQWAGFCQLATATSQAEIVKFWNFAKRISVHINDGEAMVGKQFCVIAEEMVGSVGEFIDDRMEKHDDSDNECESEFDEEQNGEYGGLDERQSCYQQCRRSRRTIRELRERSKRVLTFAKMLKSSLEISAEYKITVDPVLLLNHLRDTGHIRIKTQHCSERLWIFTRRDATYDESCLQLLLNVTCSHEEFEDCISISQQKTGYVILMKPAEDVSVDAIFDALSTSTVRIDSDTMIALSYISEAAGLYLVAANASQLPSYRREFERCLKDEVSIVNEQCSCHEITSKFLYDLKNRALSLREKICQWLDDLANDLDDKEFTTTKEAEALRDVVMHAYNFAFEYHKELSKLLSTNQRGTFAKAMREFAMQWMSFVMQYFESGRGIKPSWAHHGLHFLRLTVEPRFTLALDDEEFETLKQKMNAVVSHIIGKESDTDESPCRSGLVSSCKSWPPPAVSERHRSQSTQSAPTESPGSAGEKFTTGLTPLLDSAARHPSSDPGTLETVAENESNKNINREDPSLRIAAAVSVLDEKLQKRLLEKKFIGREVQHEDISVPYLMQRRVGFDYTILHKKLGQGQYGKVFVALNSSTEALMAVKQVELDPKNERQMKDMIDEITTFEGIEHPNLVRYYGIEAHRKEILIFMEFCTEGTLDDACRDGMSEVIVRRYTRQLLHAVSELHRRGIVHLDIKPLNIYLTRSKVSDKLILKLGDFGSSVRLKTSETGVGELTRCVGTYPYMAPEVVNVSDRSVNGQGYGRAADIWSVGCVVLHMITGKPPWHDLTTTAAIMWQVGNGKSPTIPSSLSCLCKHFLDLCFKVNPEQRLTAEKLLEHQFVKLKDNL